MTDKEARRILIDIADQMPSDVCADWIDAINVGVKAIDAQMGDAAEEECKSVKDCRNCKKWNKCPCGKEGHENGTSIGYSIGECQDYEPCEDCTVIKKLSKKYYVEDAYGYTDEDIVNKINEIIDAVNESSSTPQRPRGKWIKTEGSFRCSECLTFPEYIRTLNYCPECGSYNRGEENATSD